MNIHGFRGRASFRLAFAQSSQSRWYQRQRRCGFWATRNNGASRSVWLPGNCLRSNKQWNGPPPKYYVRTTVRELGLTLFNVPYPVGGRVLRQTFKLKVLSDEIRQTLGIGMDACRRNSRTPGSDNIFATASWDIRQSVSAMRFVRHKYECDLCDCHSSSHAVR